MDERKPEGGGFETDRERRIAKIILLFFVVALLGGAFGSPMPCSTSACSTTAWRRAGATARQSTRRGGDSHIGRWNLSTNSSTGLPGGGWMEKSRVSSGWRQKSPCATRLNPAASTSRRSALSSIRCSVLPTEVPSPGLAEWSA